MVNEKSKTNNDDSYEDFVSQSTGDQFVTPETFLGQTYTDYYLQEEDDETGGVEGDVNLLKLLNNKTTSILEEYFVDPPEEKKDTFLEGWEVGDDRVDVSDCPSKLARGLAIQELIFDMRTSEEDTFISSSIWNFCENSNVVPATRTGSYDMARKSGKFKNINFVDVPTMRIIIDCQKGDRSHSSTTVGKAGMMAARSKATREDCWTTSQLASFIQDSCLRTSRMPEPKYLPKIMGGAGCNPLFGNYLNTYLYMMSYRGGNYHRLYGSATKELMECIRVLENDQISEAPLCTFLRKKQEYLHGTYDNIVMIPKPKDLQEIKGLVRGTPIYRGSSSINYIRATESRLVAAKVLLGRRQAEIELEKAQRTEDIIFGYTPAPYVNLQHKSKKMNARKKYENALSANTAYMNLINRSADGSEIEKLIGLGWNYSSTGSRAFTRLDAQWLADGGKGEIYTIDNITFPEDMFIRTEVSTEETYKVGGIPLSLTDKEGSYYVKTTTSKVGLYEISGNMLTWAEDHADRLVNLRNEKERPLTLQEVTQIYAIDREWVNDDLLLIAEAIRLTLPTTQGVGGIGLISKDTRLAKRMASSCNTNVYLMNPSDVITHIQRENWNSLSKVTLGELKPYLGHYENVKMNGVLIDTGSLMHACAPIINMDKEITSPDVNHTWAWENISSSYELDGTRKADYRLTKSKKLNHIRVKVLRPLLDGKGRKKKKR